MAVTSVQWLVGSGEGNHCLNHQNAHKHNSIKNKPGMTLV